MRSAERCSVHIVTWNAARHLPALFQSLDRQDTSAFTVTVVDNASDDGTEEWIRRHRPDVVLLRNFRNQGFAKAHNQAISLSFSRWANADLASHYVLVANPDLVFDDSAIRQLMVFMDAHPEVAACAPKLLRMGPPEDADDPFSAPRASVIDAMGIQMSRSRRATDRGAGEEDRGQYDAEHEVFGVSGACALYRASALKAVAEEGNVFDEDFFLYKEDVDLAWRLRLRGCRAFVVPTSRVWHERAAKSDARHRWLSAFRARRAKSNTINFHSARNHGWMILKNEDVVNLLMHAPWIVPYECAKWIANSFTVTGWKAHLASLAGVARMLKKRRVIHTRRSATPADIRTWMV